MKAYDNLEEFGDPPNYDIEEGERSAPFYTSAGAQALLPYNGFQILQQYGSWNKEPLSGSSPQYLFNLQGEAINARMT